MDRAAYVHVPPQFRAPGSKVQLASTVWDFGSRSHGDWRTVTGGWRRGCQKLLCSARFGATAVKGLVKPLTQVHQQALAPGRTALRPQPRNLRERRHARWSRRSS